VLLSKQGSNNLFSSNSKNNLSQISVAFKTVLFFYLAIVLPISSKRISTLDGPRSAILVAISSIVLYAIFKILT